MLKRKNDLTIIQEQKGRRHIDPGLTALMSRKSDAVSKCNEYNIVELSGVGSKIGIYGGYMIP